MSNTADVTAKKGAYLPPQTTAADVEGQPQGRGFGVPAILRRWRREDLLKRGTLALRGLGFLFSAISFIVMASNRHGNWQNYDEYEEYRYVLAIAIISTFYTGAQAVRQIHEHSTGRQLLSPRTLAFIDFFGDQILAYLLISAASSAIPLTNKFRSGSDNIFTDSSSASIAMEILAFIALALSSILYGYKLSTQSYI